MGTWTVQQAGDWSRRSDNADSPWYDGGVQSARLSVPADGDSVNGKLSTLVIFDVDQSGFGTGLAKLDLLGGYLKASETVDSYLKCACDFTSTVNGAEYRVGTSESVVFPVARTHTLYFNGNHALKMVDALKMKPLLYCSEPTVKYCRTTGTEAIGQTVLEVDTDLTGVLHSSHWKDGAEILICDIGSREPEIRTIAAGGIASGSITITAGLTAAKNKYATIALITRNVRIVSSSTAITLAMIQYGIPGGVVNAEIRCDGHVNNTAFRGCSDFTIGGVAISGTNLPVLNDCDRADIRGVLSGYAIQASTGIKVASGALICGTALGVTDCISPYVESGALISGNQRGIYNCKSIVVSGEVSGNTYNIFESDGILNGAVLRYGTNDFYGICAILGYSAVALSSIQSSELVNSLIGKTITGRPQIIIRDYAGTPGSTRGWMYAGTITDRSGVEPEFAEGNTYKFTPSVATHPTYLDYEFYMSVGQKVRITVYLQKTTLAWAEEPNFSIFYKADDPFDGGTAAYTQSMVDNINEQYFEYAYTAIDDGIHTLRIQAKNASGYFYTSALTEVISEELTKLELIEDDVDTIKTQLALVPKTDGVLPLNSTANSTMAAAVRSNFATELANIVTIAGQLTGITSLANWLRGIFRKDAMDATAKSEVNIGGGLYDETAQSNEALADAIDNIEVDNDAIAEAVVTEMDDNSLIRKMQSNRKVLDKTAFTLTVYDDDKVTPLVVFDLKDASSNPAWQNIMEFDPQ